MHSCHHTLWAWECRTARHGGTCCRRQRQAQLGLHNEFQVSWRYIVRFCLGIIFIRVNLRDHPCMLSRQVKARLRWERWGARCQGKDCFWSYNPHCLHCSVLRKCKNGTSNMFCTGWHSGGGAYSYLLWYLMALGRGWKTKILIYHVIEPVYLCVSVCGSLGLNPQPYSIMNYQRTHTSENGCPEQR